MFHIRRITGNHDRITDFKINGYIEEKPVTQKTRVRKSGKCHLTKEQCIRQYVLQKIDKSLPLLAFSLAKLDPLSTNLHYRLLSFTTGRSLLISIGLSSTYICFFLVLNLQVCTVQYAWEECNLSYTARRLNTGKLLSALERGNWSTTHCYPMRTYNKVTDDISTWNGAKLATTLVRQQFRWSMKDYLVVEIFVCGHEGALLNVTDLCFELPDEILLLFQTEIRKNNNRVNQLSFVNTPRTS